MLLAMDIGNSSISVGVFADTNESLPLKDQPCTVFKLTTSVKRCSDEYAVMISNMFDLYKIHTNSISDVIISSVVPQLNSILCSAVETVMKSKCLPVPAFYFVGPGVKNGLNIQIDDPSQLGADIVANTVAALNIVKHPLIIIDMGTATTVTAVDDTGRLIGTSIIPGVRTSLDGMIDTASLLFHSTLTDFKNEKGVELLGKNTKNSMNSGIIYGNAFMVDGFIRRLDDMLGKQDTSKVSIIATGGYARMILKHSEFSDRIQIYDHLTLLGLYQIYCINRKRRKKDFV